MTDEEKFFKLMEDFGVKVQVSKCSKEVLADISNTNYVATVFKFDENGKFKFLDCFN